ncbi:MULTISPECIES: CDP-diacylglycerol--glycerol-3-phosphate 3-phosphatidyltransferase [Streptomyces]|jgi:CDP-diacylglycerol--glycerol-3-phosphate 3-phosphatidyltransferase|uniref:CDP-diacylglycerol--glycerol-3-phosphate 3-phosphatidyltransferase n=2 Tax=Streptomyces albidoflavus TaxID=1886 RepID=A0A126Y3M2_9ACTN|nr:MULTISPECIES: CDP-diacylglycerol--glycerol-3-phosphate 3-phosphatidyltransferase [Streptomyces]AMM07901.1 CDP-diacylglycerol--glycerol-3-phosphate 3-phosphatidyltransferase [Streptomyces albidoflavus]AWL35094.1 CDP-diacylglycerol--glycerol-3-phosphate 3-phosphatidyltransferase [Streptomyces sp. SM17]KUL55791.1 CDP-diacylglycerol--glycerol-3-phosphate 3-phosphatidyltransferase [Streptomyces albidoflavus]MBK3385798.1 CDP-diacylglycerol--glycerol-3-phosphate 3-phosphatidyltransferase [Streptomy
MTGVSASTAGGAHAGGVHGASRGTPAVRQAGVWNIANILTMIRLLLVPGFVALLLADGGYDPAWRALAWAAFAVAMITDVFDGHLARTYNLVTDFGKIADPIADKAIMGAALICLSWLGELPWWVTAVILGRELGITVLRFWVIRFGVIPASRGGKLKTLAQGTAAGMYVLALTGPLATLRFWVMAVAVVLTVATGLDYVRQAVVLRRAGLAAERAARREAATGAQGTVGEVGPAVPTATASEALVATAASAAGPAERTGEAPPAAGERAGQAREQSQDAAGARQVGGETRR